VGGGRTQEAKGLLPSSRSRLRKVTLARSGRLCTKQTPTKHSIGILQGEKGRYGKTRGGRRAPERLTKKRKSRQRPVYLIRVKGPRKIGEGRPNDHERKRGPKHHAGPRQTRRRGRQMFKSELKVLTESAERSYGGTAKTRKEQSRHEDPELASIRESPEEKKMKLLET